MTASAILGKIVIAGIADRTDLRILTAFTASLGIVQCGVLLLTPSFTLLLVTDCLADMAVGGTYPMFSALVAERFGTAAYGWVRGLMSPMVAPNFLKPPSSVDTTRPPACRAATSTILFVTQA